MFSDYIARLMLDSFFDQLTLSKGLYDAKGEPRFTTGSIVNGALLRAILVIVVGFALWYWRGDEMTYALTFLLLWGYVAYPAYRQYIIFNQHIEQYVGDTLCGQCRHFNATAQSCFRYDEHVTETYVPCEGLDWEPRS